MRTTQRSRVGHLHIVKYYMHNGINRPFKRIENYIPFLFKFKDRNPLMKEPSYISNLKPGLVNNTRHQSTLSTGTVISNAN